MLAACSSSAPAPPPSPTVSPAPAPEPVASPADPRVDQLTAELETERQRSLALEDDLAEAQATVAALEERNAALEAELAGAVEEVLRSKSGARGVQSRAVAVSRISEVRVELDALPARVSGTADRIERANELLNRADGALADGNFGGASYLAERAYELIRQARLVAAMSGDDGADLIAIVPPRSLEVVSNANLREGPGTNHARIGGVATGDRVEAEARSGNWYRVRTESGLVAWVHRRLVR